MQLIQLQKQKNPSSTTANGLHFFNVHNPRNWLAKMLSLVIAKESHLISFPRCCLEVLKQLRNLNFERGGEGSFLFIDN
jgi:hypothetical protein